MYAILNVRCFSLVHLSRLVLYFFWGRHTSSVGWLKSINHHCMVEPFPHTSLIRSFSDIDNCWRWLVVSLKSWQVFDVSSSGNMCAIVSIKKRAIKMWQKSFDLYMSLQLHVLCIHCTIQIKYGVEKIWELTSFTLDYLIRTTQVYFFPVSQCHMLNLSLWSVLLCLSILDNRRLCTRMFLSLAHNNDYYQW